MTVLKYVPIPTIVKKHTITTLYLPAASFDTYLSKLSAPLAACTMRLRNFSRILKYRSKNIVNQAEKSKILWKEHKNIPIMGNIVEIPVIEIIRERIPRDFSFPFKSFHKKYIALKPHDIKTVSVNVGETPNQYSKIRHTIREPASSNPACCFSTFRSSVILLSLIFSSTKLIFL